MKPAETKRALEILDDAHELSDDELESYLDSVCGEDSALRREVLGYLDCDVGRTVFPVGMDNGSLPEIPDATTTTSATRYELGDEIARGGMGVVLRAFDNNIRRNVAIKVLQREWESKPEIVGRFLQEARIGGQLQHPGIAPVYEIGRLPDGRPFIAMKLVKGTTLRDLLARRRDASDDLARFLGIFEHVCEAIAFAHRRGVIHRDLKPGNVMVGEFGEVQVMDWGIAKLVGDDDPQTPESEVASCTETPGRDPVNVDTDGAGHLTRVGQVMGTPAYMAPEQSIGRADRTADVFSLGAILCEILTGEKTGGDTDTAREQLDRCGCDQALAELAKDCLQPNQADRPVDAGVVATRISAHLGAIQSRLKEVEIAAARAEVKAEEERKRRQRTLRTIGAVVVVLMLVGMVGWFVRNSSHQRSLRERTETIVTALSTARGILAPHVIADLEELPSTMVVAELHGQFNSADEVMKLPLAYGLAHFGDVRVDFLLSQVASTSPDEVDNLVQALGEETDEAVPVLEAAALTAETQENWRHRARLAMLALQLNAPTLARDICQPRPNPIQRTLFIEECSTWHGSLSRLAPLVGNESDGSLRSAIALAVGSVSPRNLAASDKRAWWTTLANWYQKQPDTGTHSAAGWALRRWNLQLPVVTRSKQSSENRHWRLNSVGMTMLELPAESFVHKGEISGDTIEHPVTLTRPFLLADYEVTRAQYQQFIDDPQCPSDEKPSNWGGANIRGSPTERHPVQTVSWYEALLFCNWLSRFEELTPCYQRTGQTEKIGGMEHDAWKLVPDACGYRLPTEAEWEYACRSGTETSYYFGEEESLLDRYAIYRASHTELPGSKRPNPWGLFDTHGNVWEWCQDWNRAFTGDISHQDPSRITDSHRAMRGGSFTNTVSNVRSASRFSAQPDSRGNCSGFRVARTHP